MLIFLLLSYLKTFHKKSEIENLLQGCPFFSSLSIPLYYCRYQLFCYASRIKTNVSHLLFLLLTSERSIWRIQVLLKDQIPPSLERLVSITNHYSVSFHRFILLFFKTDVCYSRLRRKTNIPGKRSVTFYFLFLSILVKLYFEVIFTSLLF